MSGMEVPCTISEVPCDRYGPATPLMSRLAEGTAPAGFPRLDPAGLTRWEPAATVDRRALAETLDSLNRQWGNPLSPATVSAICGEGVFVIGGQQPMLAGGPVMCLLKLASVLGLADWLARRIDRPVVPAFWLAGEDHDLEEVNRLTLGRQVVVCEHDQPSGRSSRRPVAGLSPQAARRPVLEALERVLPDGPNAGAVRAILEQADWSSYPALFATVMGRLLPEGRQVVWVEPTAMRNLAVAAMQQVLRRMPDVLERFEAGRAMLREQGFSPPLERVGLFEMVDGRRLACRLTREGAVLHDGAVGWDELAERVAGGPERFSPGAALRPVVQDLMLPVAVTVAGPTELLYLWQLDPVYQAAGACRSMLAARLSATLLDRPMVELARRFGLEGAGLFQADRLLKEYNPIRYPVDDEDLLELERMRDDLVRRMQNVGQAVMGRGIDKACRSVVHQVDKVIGQVREARLERTGLGKSRLAHLASRLVPGGRLSERVMAAVEAVGRWGNRWVAELLGRYEPDRPVHQLLVFEAPPDRAGQSKGETQ